MPKVSINILTKDRAELLKQALLSVAAQTFQNFEIVVVNDGSSDETDKVISDFQFLISKQFSNPNFKILKHEKSLGITVSRQEALLTSTGEYVAILDDDDEWADADKLAKQVKYLDEHPETVLAGGGIKIEFGSKNDELRMRPQEDKQIRNTMLFRNNFFTSTVMFRRADALKTGGFIKDLDDVVEDYDLWLRLGRKGRMYNFPGVFAVYRASGYNKAKFKLFLQKQLRLIEREKVHYPWHFLAAAILRARLWL